MPVALLVGVAGVLLEMLALSQALNVRAVFFAITALVLVYLAIEVSRLRRVHPERWLLNPIVLCSFITFVLSYGVTNVEFFLTDTRLESVGLVPDVTPAMVNLMWLVLCGAVAMWAGYWSPIAARLANRSSIIKFATRYLPQTDVLRSVALPVLFAVSLLTRLLQVRLGVFGYSADYDQLIAMGAVTQYLAFGSGLGKVALVLAAMQFYAHRSSLSARRWLYFLLLVEVSFGFLSGFKSAVIMPAVTVAFCQYLRTGRFSKSWIVVVVVGLLVAYAVIEPFRLARYGNSTFSGTSVVSIAGTLIESAGSSADDTVNEVGGSAPVLFSIASRSNLTNISSFGIEYADIHPIMPAGSPNFLSDLFLAPLHAWIPRFIWGSKPLGNLGLWYNQEVMQMSDFSSSGMGPFTYLYFAGGVVAVFVGFLFVGVVQRCLFFLLQPASSIAGGAVFLAMLSTVAVIDSAFNSIIVSLCRELPLALLIMFLLFRGRAKSVPDSVSLRLGG